MSYKWLDQYDAEDKIEAILEWHREESKDFDPSFVLDLQEKIEDGRDLSEGQEKALDNIIKKWKVDLDYFQG
jgi:hypothetical protein